MVTGLDKEGDVCSPLLWSDGTACWEPNVLLMTGVLLYRGQGLEESDGAD